MITNIKKQKKEKKEEKEEKEKKVEKEECVCLIIIIILLTPLFIFGIISQIIEQEFIIDSTYVIQIIIYMFNTLGIFCGLLSILLINYEPIGSVLFCICLIFECLGWILGIISIFLNTDDFKDEYELTGIYFEICLWTQTSILALSILVIILYCIGVCVSYPGYDG